MALNLTDAHGRRYEHEDWQIYTLEGIFIALNYKLREILVIRARGGSKTHDMMCICLYFTYLGWRVIYFCSKASQMTQPKKYMRRIIDGSFLIYCIKKPHREFYAKEAVEFEGGGSLQILNLTESKGRSPRCDVVLYDEESEAEEDAYMAAESILDGSDIGLTIHASTPVKGSKFEENHDALKLREAITGHELIFSREYDEISFLVDTPAKRAKYEEKKRKWPGWFFRQELQCSFELRSGAVFQNVIYEPYEAWLENSIKDESNCSGVDWNPAAGHVRSTVKWTPDLQSVVVVGEAVFSTGYAREMKRKEFATLRKWFSKGNSIVLEDGGINIPYIDWFNDMLEETNFNWPEQRWAAEEWDNQDIAKMKACTYIMQHGITIYVDKIRFPLTAKQIEECSWDEKAKGSNPKLKKDNANSPHFLDAFLHAISEKNRDDLRYEVADW